MKKSQTVIIILLVLILLGVVLALANVYNNYLRVKALSETTLQKIDQLNLTPEQKQKVISVLEQAITEEVNVRASTTPVVTPNPVFVPAPDTYIPPRAQQSCTSDLQCSFGETCFECHGNVSNQNQVFPKKCMTAAEVAQQRAHCAAE